VPIAVIQEAGLLCIAADGDDVVESTGKFEAEWASHETRDTTVQEVQGQELPPPPFLLNCLEP
jgi:hypothetical protein